MTCGGGGYLYKEEAEVKAAVNSLVLYNQGLNYNRVASNILPAPVLLPDLTLEQ